LGEVERDRHVEERLDLDVEGGAGDLGDVVRHAVGEREGALCREGPGNEAGQRLRDAEVDVEVAGRLPLLVPLELHPTIREYDDRVRVRAREVLLERGPRARQLRTRIEPASGTLPQLHSVGSTRD